MVILRSVRLGFSHEKEPKAPRTAHNTNIMKKSGALRVAPLIFPLLALGLLRSTHARLDCLRQTRVTRRSQIDENQRSSLIIETP